MHDIFKKYVNVWFMKERVEIIAGELLCLLFVQNSCLEKWSVDKKISSALVFTVLSWGHGGDRRGIPVRHQQPSQGNRGGAPLFRGRILYLSYLSSCLCLNIPCVFFFLTQVSHFIYTVCPGSSDPFYIVS